MVADDWQEGEPIPVMVAFVTPREELMPWWAETGEYEGVIRDIWWEGIDQETIDYFKDHYGLVVDRDCVLIEVKQGTKDEIWLVFMGIVILLVGGWFYFYRRRQRRAGVL